MPIRLRCPHCNAKLSIASRKAGQTINCPGCNTSIEVPPSEDTAPPQKHPPQTAAPEGRRAAGEMPEDDEGGVTFRRPDSEFEEMDLTPMVDVTFLLLIFFMITASFTIQKTLRFPPPEPEKEGVSQTPQKPEDFKETSVMIEIDENNQFTVDGETVADRSALSDVIRRKMYAESRPKTEVVIVRHYFSSHEMTVLAADAAMEAEIQKIRMGIKPGTAPPD